MSVEIKQAVERARLYLTDLFPVHGPLELEEVEPHPHHPGAWRITFSYDREDADEYGIRRFLPPEARPRTRIYKVVTVNSDGEPESVKMRSDAA